MGAAVLLAAVPGKPREEREHMAVQETSGVLGYKDENGELHIHYPVTKLENVDGLDEALAAEAAAREQGLKDKADVGHTHTTDQVTGLDAALAGKADTGHTHTAADVGALDRYTVMIDEPQTEDDIRKLGPGTYGWVSASRKSWMPPELTAFPTRFSLTIHNVQPGWNPAMTLRCIDGAYNCKMFIGDYTTTRMSWKLLANAVHTHTKSQITDFPASLPASDVYDWAKASTKPSYTAAEVGAVPTDEHSRYNLVNKGLNSVNIDTAYNSNYVTGISVAGHGTMPANVSDWFTVVNILCGKRRLLVMHQKRIKRACLNDTDGKKMLNGASG